MGSKNEVEGRGRRERFLQSRNVGSSTSNPVTMLGTFLDAARFLDLLLSGKKNKIPISYLDEHGFSFPLAIAKHSVE